MAVDRGRGRVEGVGGVGEGHEWLGDEERGSGNGQVSERSGWMCFFFFFNKKIAGPKKTEN